MKTKLTFLLPLANIKFPNFLRKLALNLKLNFKFKFKFKKLAVRALLGLKHSATTSYFKSEKTLLPGF